MSKKPTHKGAGSACAPLSFSPNFLNRPSYHPQAAGFNRHKQRRPGGGDWPRKRAYHKGTAAKCSSLQAAEWDHVLCARLQEIFFCEAKFSLFQGDFSPCPAG